MVQLAKATIAESVAGLLGAGNPCSISEKDLRRELKRCRKCLTFSGEDVVMQVPCGNVTRRIRMDILDRDLFDPHPSMPEHTSWTMALLGRLEQAFGSATMERPAFALSPDVQSGVPDSRSSPLLEALEQGKLDGLFKRGEVRPSEVFRQAQHPPPGPSVQLVASSPIHPVSYAVPNYPPIARLAGIEGPVTFRADIDSNGNLLNLKFVSGHVMLQKAVAASVGNWTFAVRIIRADYRDDD
jgi:hypothetical protein